MAYKFEQLLLKEKIQESELSTKLKKLISDLRKLVMAIPAAEQRLKNGNISVAVSEKLTEQIADSKTAIPEMDAEICEGIKKWIPNREKNAAVGRRLAEARANAAGGKTPAAAAAPAAPAQPAAPASSTTPVKQHKPATPAATTQEPKKGVSAWGWVFLGLTTVGLTLLGIKGYQAMKDNKAA